MLSVCKLTKANESNQDVVIAENFAEKQLKRRVVHAEEILSTLC